MRSGALLLADNTLQNGAVLDASKDDANTVAIRDFNAKVAADDRVRQVLLPIGDGVTVIQKL
jgi:caffeoyl-CoA O-methyltransferase